MLSDQKGSFVGRQVALRRAAALTSVSVLALALTGCDEKTSHEWGNFAMPDPVTSQGVHTLELWQGAWYAALAVGFLTWGLIFWAAWRYRRRSADQVPVQTRYNLPLEIFYTIAPIVMVVVFFVHTERTQNLIRDEVPNPDVTIYVVGQQWTWTFNYLPGGEVNAAGDKNLYTVGEAGAPPTLVLPVGKTVEFKLHSPDVIHDFGVPGFLEKMDVIPGPVAEDNHFQVKPMVTGTYKGACYELCGVYHSRMLFNVKIVSDADFQAYLQTLVDQGDVSDQPLLGGITSQTQAGLGSQGGSE